MILILVTFLISALLTLYFSRPNSVLQILAHPNERSLHSQPTPSTGGVAIVIALSPWHITMPEIFYLCLLLIFIISFIDDCRHVSILYRLMVHFIATCLLLWQGEFWLTDIILPGLSWTLPPFLQISLSCLFVIWMINLYNFMDGMDGFAAGMGIFGFGTLAILGAEHQLFMTLNLIIASAVAGFLVFNFPPARIFMGDTGASSLGFLAAALSLWGNREGIFPLWIALLIFSPFIVDATVTLLRRLLRGEKFWLAHKSHYYQRLVQIGWGHKRTVLWEYVLMAACSISALIAPSLSIEAQWTLLVGWCLSYIILIYLVNKL
ncbi:hypothetical protein PN36_04985 [Candidatus Thiomargarita nelsonii]|uniref:Uncharacterized protein n=1 Tax=Candidatus Thiomargarita nelsonii TaxID=1003181 RepID=A0A4E0QS55_9GAMM|nr:hypothetical protein PN36_04985 [Candidatus Thiomargarita nelsonii]